MRMQFTTRSSSLKLMVHLGLHSSLPFLTPLTIALNYPHNLYGLGQKIGHPNLPNLAHKYHLKWAHPDTNLNPDLDQPPTVPHYINPSYAKHLKVFHFIYIIFCAPSNPSTAAGIYYKTIQALGKWYWYSTGTAPHLRSEWVYAYSKPTYWL